MEEVFKITAINLERKKDNLGCKNAFGPLMVHERKEREAEKIKKKSKL